MRAQQDNELTERLMAPSERHRHRADPTRCLGVELAPTVRVMVYVVAMLGLTLLAVTLWWAS